MPETESPTTGSPVPFDEFAKIVSERDAYKKAYLDLLTINKALERGILFHGRERVPSDDVTLPLLAMLARQEEPVTPATEKQPVQAHERAKPTGRKPLPEKLPRVDVEVVPPEVEAKGRDAFEQIGEDVSEVVERRPASLVVLRVHRPKFVEKDQERNAETTIAQAPPPELPIPRGVAGPAMLAHTVVSRWADHLPLHRLERIYGRDGLDLSRSTVCDWHFQLAELARPLLLAMWKDALASPYLCADATGVLVQQIEKCRTGHFFVVAAPEKHVLFGYSPKHNSDAVDKLLAGYKGYLVADAHSVYDHLFLGGDVVEVGCWAHTRRYFFKSLGSDPDRAKLALEFIGKLFEIERLNKSTPPEGRLKARRDFSKAVVESFFAWCDAESLRVLDETPISKAIQYARNQKLALSRFLEDGRLPIHNNWSERELRREAVGRKNWLFVGSDEGGEVNAIFVSLIASCQLHGIEPLSYLRDLFCLLPSWNQTEVLQLSPLHWRATLERDNVRAALAANFFRRASLGEFDPK